MDKRERIERREKFTVVLAGYLIIIWGIAQSVAILLVTK